MKVIKIGRPQKGWAKELECTGKGNRGGGCGAILLVDEGDVFKTSRSCRDETDYFATFRCPECGSLTDIDNHPFSAWALPLEKNLTPRESSDDIHLKYDH